MRSNMSGSRRLTCCRTRRIKSAVYYVVSFHPPLDLVQVYFSSSHLESELAFVYLDKLPLLALSHNRLHLLLLDILVFAPLADA